MSTVHNRAKKHGKGGEAATTSPAGHVPVPRCLRRRPPSHALPLHAAHLQALAARQAPPLILGSDGDICDVTVTASNIQKKKQSRVYLYKI